MAKPKPDDGDEINDLKKPKVFDFDEVSDSDNESHQSVVWNIPFDTASSSKSQKSYGEATTRDIEVT